jgi:hypothetical protein
MKTRWSVFPKHNLSMPQPPYVVRWRAGVWRAANPLNGVRPVPAERVCWSRSEAWDQYREVALVQVKRIGKILRNGLSQIGCDPCSEK